MNDFKTIQTLSVADLSKYQQQVIKQDEHILKIWTAKNASEIVSTIIEINSVYPIDTANDGSRLKDTIIYNDYFLILKDTTKNIHYQTINRQGVSKYAIGNRQVYATREMILVGLFYINNTEKLKQLLNKYNYSSVVRILTKH